MTTPNSTAIHSVREFLDKLKLDEHHGVEGIAKHWIFRGQIRTRGSEDGWPLLPKAGRKSGFGAGLNASQGWKDAEVSIGAGGTRETKIQPNFFAPHDIVIFEEWCSRAIAYMPALPSNEWERLALAQHYGLATRLLDWSLSPLIALFFAVEADDMNAGAVYAYLRPHERILPDKHRFWDIGSENGGYDANLLSVAMSDVAIYEPRPFDRRMLQQRAVFTYHTKPLEPVVPMHERETERWCKEIDRFGTDLMEFIIDGTWKRPLRRELSMLGIDRETLFPDLEGLSAQLNFSRWKGSYTARSTCHPIA